jgi:hypothetical protein
MDEANGDKNLNIFCPIIFGQKSNVCEVEPIKFPAWRFPKRLMALMINLHKY